MQDQKIAPTENPDRPPEVTASQVNALLPQTQCRQCGFDACLPYAQAIACGEAPINRCPPGGQSGIQKLAALTGLAEIGLDPAFGSEHKRRLAWIDPNHCIGCTLCIQACPVDAIVGASKAMHAVIASHCTGCELCVAPCPVDCIELRPPQHSTDWTRSDANAARQRFERRNPQNGIERTAERRIAKAQHHCGGRCQGEGTSGSFGAHGLRKIKLFVSVAGRIEAPER